MTGGVWVHIEKRATPLVNTAVFAGRLGFIEPRRNDRRLGAADPLVSSDQPGAGARLSYRLFYFRGRECQRPAHAGGGDPPLFLAAEVALADLGDERGDPADPLLFHRPETPLSDEAPEAPGKKIWIEGGINFLFLGVILVSLFQPTPFREISLIVSAVAGYKLSKKEILERI